MRLFHGIPVEAVMLKEAVILGGDHCGAHRRGDLTQRNPGVANG